MLRKFTISLLFLLSVGIGFSQKNANEFYIQGVQRFDQKKLNEALSYFDQALKLNPQFSEAYLKRGACYLIFQDFKKAILDFDKVIELTGGDELAYYNRGIAYRSIGQPTKAVLDFTKVIEMNPDFGLAFFNRALSKLSLDDYTGACPDLSRAADLGVATAAELYKYNCLNQK